MHNLIEIIGPTGVLVLVAIGLLLLLKVIGHTGRKALRRAAKRILRKAVRYIRITAWAARLEMPIKLAYRLQHGRWEEMCHDRDFVGLKRGVVKKSKVGIDVHVTLNRKLTLELLSSKVSALEAGLGTKRGVIRISPGKTANKAIVRIVLRDPLAKDVSWVRPIGDVSISDLCRVSMVPSGDWIQIKLQQRILIAGASGSGKSVTQRILAAQVIMAKDADLEVWDLKHGTESQHYAGKVIDRITTSSEAGARIKHYMQVELPRRARIMKELGTSTWPTSEKNPDRVIMIDEGSDLTRHLKKDELKQMYTLVEMARAFGIYIWWATQMPKATNLPTELRSQMSCVIALKLGRKGESQIVFEDRVHEGFTPHSLPGKGWMFVLDAEHQVAQESKAPYISEGQFKGIKPARPSSFPPPFPVHDPDVPEKVSLEKEKILVTPLNTPKAILEALKGGEVFSATQLIESTGRSKSQVYDSLNQLLSEGKVIRESYGKYRSS